MHQAEWLVVHSDTPPFDGNFIMIFILQFLLELPDICSNIHSWFIIRKGFWLEKPERWNVGGSDLVGDLHTLDFQLSSLSPPSSLAAAKARTV